MNKKAIIIGLSVISVGALAYAIISNIKRKKETEELQKSVDELTKKYKVFN
jgi:hypothetical protein